MVEQVGESRLWKITELVRSKNFPPMVESAAWQVGKEFTADMVRDVATSPALLDLVDQTGEDGMDAALAELRRSPTGGALDQAIIDAVTAHIPKENA